jgi:hypothetical protein
MLRIGRVALAGVAALVAASCTLLAPLDGLTGNDAPEAGEAAADVATPVDVTADGGTPSDAGADVTSDVKSDAPLQGDGEAGAVSYSATVLADTPLAYWRLDETTGTVCHDATGHGNDATYVGAVTLGVAGALVGDPDTAVQFDGNTAQIDVGDKFDFVGKVPLSIEMWANPDVIDNGFRHLERKMLYDAFQPSDGMYFYVNAGPKPLAFERWSGGVTDNGMKAYVTTGAWWHIVGTFDGTNLSIYVNGSLAATTTTGTSLVANGVHLLWGEAFQGRLDELAIYDHALSAARIQAHYMAGQ